MKPGKRARTHFRNADGEKPDEAVEESRPLTNNLDLKKLFLGVEAVSSFFISCTLTSLANLNAKEAFKEYLTLEVLMYYIIS